MANDLSKKSTRAKLQPRREPYWQRLTEGVYIGYRVLTSGAGTWIARRRTDEGKQKYKALGSTDRFDLAAKEAQLWAKADDMGVTDHDATVRDACKSYVDRQRIHKGEKAAQDAGGRFQRLVYDQAFAKIKLSKLTTRHVSAWLNDQVANDDDPEVVRRSKDTANRNLAALKAALNHAMRLRMVESDAGWKTVKSFPKVGASRVHMLSLAERRSLLEHAPKDLALLIKALLLTGARPGEVAMLKVADYDKTTGSVRLSGKTGERVATVSTATRELFTEASKNKLPNAPLFPRADGQPWNKDAWKKPLKQAVRAAGLADDVVLYTLRHTAISELIAGGMDSHLVAKLAGTSTAMIDKHYGHLRHDMTRAMLDSVRMV